MLKIDIGAIMILLFSICELLFEYISNDGHSFKARLTQVNKPHGKSTPPVCNIYNATYTRSQNERKSAHIPEYIACHNQTRRKVLNSHPAHSIPAQSSGSSSIVSSLTISVEDGRNCPTRWTRIPMCQVGLIHGWYPLLWTSFRLRPP